MMKKSRAAIFASVLVFVLAPPIAAQYTVAEVSGSVKDESGGVLPGVTVTATEKETGTIRTTTTVEDGTYTMKSMPTGSYNFKVELAGFRTLVREGVTLSVGQSVRLDFVITVGQVAETITVQAEAPLIEPTKSDLSGVVSKKQLESLPLNGRDWLDLSLIAPGAKNSQGSPTAGVGDVTYTKIIVDGAEANNKCCPTLVNIRVSEDALSEFQVITNRFDARYGRAGSAIVNASTKSGTNDFHGSFFLFVRDQRFNSKDFFTNRVEPFHNDQVGVTFGGPIVHNRTHFFFNFERQNEPRTISANTGIPTLDAAVDSAANRKFYLGRIDHQFNSSNRVYARLLFYRELLSNFNVGGVNPLQHAFNRPLTSDGVVLGWTGVLSQRSVNEFRFVLTNNLFENDPLVNSPEYNFPSAVIGTPFNQPSRNTDLIYHLRDDFSHYISTSRGNHDLKVGGELEYIKEGGFFCLTCRGQFFFNSDPANFATCCLSLDATTWDRSQFPAPTRYQQGLGSFGIDVSNTILSGYVQDDWTINPRLTFNLGVRYDLEVGSLGENFARTNFLGRPNRDTKNIQPRLGFAYDLTGHGRTILRGGGGIYYDQVYLNITFDQQVFNGNSFAIANVTNNGRPNFLQDPLSGRTFQDFVSGAAPTDIRPIAPDAHQPKDYTGSIGVAQQVGENLSVAADYVHTKGVHMLMEVDGNLFCCTANGFPLPVQQYGRPYPQFARIREFRTPGNGVYDGLQLAVNRRFVKGYGFGITYLLSRNKDNTNGAFNTPNNPFNLQDEFANSLQDQRHRFVGNWVATLPLQISFSGVFFAASGQTIQSTTGGRDVNGDGSTGGDRPFCDPSIPACGILGIPAGTLISRNPTKADPVARVDLRLSRKFTVVGRLRAEGIIEWFNVFNRRNYDSAQYVTNVFSARYMQPGRSTLLAYQPRQMQLGVRVTF